MDRCTYGLTRRTHGVRPSEKTAFRVMPGFSRQNKPSLDRPRRGGAGSARPQTRLCLHRGIAPIKPPGFRLPPMIMLCLGLRIALPRGRTECVPPRKPPFAPSPGLPPKPSVVRRPRRGGAGSARPQGRLGLNRGMCPLGNRPFARSYVARKRLATRTAWPSSSGNPTTN